MQLKRLELSDFRSHQRRQLDFAPGCCVISGANGRGKTNIVEAVVYLATGSSFRGAPNEALVRLGSDAAVVRCAFEREGRDQLVEAELKQRGRSRMLLNRQRVARTADLGEGILVVVFSPDDLELVKGGPGERRRFLDEVGALLHPAHARLKSDLDKILKQRNTLLKQSGGRLDGDTAATLDVWDARLVETGSALAQSRERVVELIEPRVIEAVQDLDHGRGPGGVGLEYLRSWSGDFAGALVETRREELRRGLTLVGPHRDELSITLDAMPSRTHASQGQQRSLALALRLASHRCITDVRGVAPVLVLDDVLSELDPERAAALLDNLPQGQCLLTSAHGVPDGVVPAVVIDLDFEGRPNEPVDAV